MMFGAAAIALGLATAAAAHRFPAREAEIERWAGGSFVAGLLLVGLGFPML